MYSLLWSAMGTVSFSLSLSLVCMSHLPMKRHSSNTQNSTLVEEAPLIDAVSELNQWKVFSKGWHLQASHKHKTHMDSVLRILRLYQQLFHSSLLVRLLLQQQICSLLCFSVEFGQQGEGVGRQGEKNDTVILWLLSLRLLKLHESFL